MITGLRPRCRNSFKRELVLVPSLNATAGWVEAVSRLAERHDPRRGDEGSGGRK